MINAACRYLSSYEFLLKGCVEDAFMELLKYKKEYLDCYDSQANYSYEDEIEKVNFVISSSPKVLGKISQNELDNPHHLSVLGKI